MINREKVLEALDAMEEFEKLSLPCDLEVKSSGYLRFWVTCPPSMDEKIKHQAIAIGTRFVGKMEAKGESWEGERDKCGVYLYRASVIKPK